MFRHLFLRFGNRGLQRRVQTLQSRVAELEESNRILRRAIRVRDAEIESLAAVVARDRERIRAESSAYARQAANQPATP